jgi:hypothetical protein
MYKCAAILWPSEFYFIAIFKPLAKKYHYLEIASSIYTAPV